MSGLTPLPITHIHHSHRLTHAQAHAQLSTFLSLTQTDPAYRPDSFLTQYGPQATNIGENSNVTLNHLTRICRGIYGESLSGIEWNDGQRDDIEEDSPRTKRRKLDEKYGVMPSSPPVMDVVAAEGEEGKAALVARELDDWQDKEEWEHAQDELTGDLGGDPTTEGIERRGEKFEIGHVPAVLDKREKDARREAKKMRRKHDARMKNIKREQKVKDEM